MKNRFTAHLTALAATSILIFGAGQALAGGTASGTDISNSASLDYTVNGVVQDQKSSDTVTFKVDKKVDLTVVTSDGALVAVTPGTSNQVLTFTVTNTGNDTQDISLSAIALANGAADPFGGSTTDNLDDNTSNISIFVESGANAGYQPLEDTATYIDELAVDIPVVVYIVRNIETTRVNNDTAVYALVGQIRAGGAGGTLGAALTQTAPGAVADDQIDTLFADAAGSDDNANEANHSDRSGFLVVTAEMNADKEQTIVGGYAIPGATVTYSITVENTGSAVATSVIVTDSIPTNTTYATISACNGTPEWHLISTGNWTASNPGNGSADVDQVRCTIASIAASDSDTVSFQVTID